MKPLQNSSELLSSDSQLGIKIKPIKSLHNLPIQPFSRLLLNPIFFFPISRRQHVLTRQFPFLWFALICHYLEGRCSLRLIIHIKCDYQFQSLETRMTMILIPSKYNVSQDGRSEQQCNTKTNCFNFRSCRTNWI